MLGTKTQIKHPPTHKQRQNRNWNQKLDIQSKLMQTLCRTSWVGRRYSYTPKKYCKAIWLNSCLPMCWRGFFVFVLRLFRSLIFDYMFLWAWCTSALGCVVNILSKWLIIIDFETIDFKIQSKEKSEKNTSNLFERVVAQTVMNTNIRSVLCPDKHFTADDFSKQTKRNQFWRSEHGTCVCVPYFFCHPFFARNFHIDGWMDSIWLMFTGS